MGQVVKNRHANAFSLDKVEVDEMGTNSETPVKPFKHTPGQWFTGKPQSLAAAHIVTTTQSPIAAAVHNVGSSIMPIQAFMSTALDRSRAKYGVPPFIAMEWHF